MNWMTRVSLTILVLLVLAPVMPVSAQQQWYVVGVVMSDASAGESSILIDATEPIQEGRRILIESRDESEREVHEIAHVYDHHIILKGRLGRPFLAGSKVYQ